MKTLNASGLFDTEDDLPRLIEFRDKAWRDYEFLQERVNRLEAAAAQRRTQERNAWLDAQEMKGRP